jgi:hypothetical protein
MRDLFATLEQRRRPEDVAEMIRTTLGDDLSRAEQAILDRAARHSLKRGYAKITSMLEEFRRPIAPERQVRKALELFERVETWTAAECADPQRVESFIRELCPLIGKQFGASDFKHNRLNGAQRVAAGLDLSRRRYNKLFRLLARLEAKLRTYLRELRKFDFTRLGKSRLATRLTWEEFARDPATGAFVAYFVARCNLRSVFTNKSQQRPYDEIAEMLYRRLAAQPERTNWWAVAHVYPLPEVLRRLTDGERGRLLGCWLAILRDIADLLREVWEAGGIDHATMIVRRGNDSTTWNNTASAWNRARENWVALLHSMGMEEELDALCFGKVLRLMAADVAWWHRRSGGGLEPDTQVWQELPLPWEVFAGTALCTRHQVETVCRRHGVDPVKNGWTAPRPAGLVQRFEPTPELVHGVMVADPSLAALLRRAGWFSAKGVRLMPGLPAPATVRRDEHGFALGVERADHPAPEGPDTTE